MKKPRRRSTKKTGPKRRRPQAVVARPVVHQHEPSQHRSASVLHARVHTGERKAENTRYFARPLRTIVTGLLLLLTLVLLVGWALTSMRPSWWTDPGALPIGAHVSAEKLERGLIRLPDMQGQSVRLPEEDANAWLVHRLPMWIANHDPALAARLGQVSVDFAPGALRIGIELKEQDRAGEYHSSGWVSLHLAHTGDGASYALSGAAFGRLAVPALVIRQQVPKLPGATPDWVRLALQQLLDGQSVPLAGTMDIDGRTLSVRSVTIERGGLLVHLADAADHDGKSADQPVQTAQ